MKDTIKFALVATLLLATSAVAAEKDLSGEDLKALVQKGRTLKLGGEGQGYTGTLVISADGTAEGFAQPDGGDRIRINGTWRIKGNTFCRTWETLDGGKEICERWRQVAPNKVEVYQGKKMAGVNSW